MSLAFSVSALAGLGNLLATVPDRFLLAQTGRFLDTRNIVPRFRVDVQKVEENNGLVWETLKLEAVPCYQSGNNFLKSHEDVMIPKERLKTFLDYVFG